MLSEEYSFDSLARQYGVNRDGIHYQDDASASSHLNDPDPSCMSMPGQGQLSVADDAMLPMASAPDTPVSFHFDFDRAKQAGLVAAKRSAIEPPPQPISSNPVRSLAPSTSTGAVNNEARDPSVSSWRHSEGASNSSMTVEPVPGRRIDLVATSKLCEYSVPCLEYTNLSLRSPAAEPYRKFFSFPFFNAVQSTCLPCVCSAVTSALDAY